MPTQDSTDNNCENVSYGASTYVWCRGSSQERGPHPIFVSSPVQYLHGSGGRFMVLSCQYEDCSAFGKAMHYDEKDLRFQDGYVPPVGREPLA